MRMKKFHGIIKNAGSHSLTLTLADGKQKTIAAERAAKVIYQCNDGRRRFLSAHLLPSRRAP